MDYLIYYNLEVEFLIPLGFQVAYAFEVYAMVRGKVH